MGRPAREHSAMEESFKRLAALPARNLLQGLYEPSAMPVERAGAADFAASRLRVTAAAPGCGLKPPCIKREPARLRRLPFCFPQRPAPPQSREGQAFRAAFCFSNVV